MTNITFTKSWSAGDDGTDITGADLGNIQTDITAAVNGNLDNNNVDASAAIEEFKVLFDTVTGHNHDGSNSRSLSGGSILLPHARSGCACRRASTSTITVEPGALNIGGTVYEIETATTLDMTTDFVSGSETNDDWFYIYATNTGTTLTFSLSTSPPSLSDTSSNTVEVPFRYDSYSSVLYRCIGAGFNNSSGNIEAGLVHSFDLSSCIMGNFSGGATGSTDFTVETVWTPTSIMLFSKHANDSLGAGDEVNWVLASDEMISDHSLVVHSSDSVTSGRHESSNLTPLGVVNAMNAQTTSAGGNFIIDQAGTSAGSRTFHFLAYTDFV